MAPGDLKLGKYECLMRAENSQQPSLDAKLGLHCLTRERARVVTCGSVREMGAAAFAMNASQRLDPTFQANLRSPRAASLAWQLLGATHAGLIRIFPAALVEARDEPYARADSRLLPWFLGAASPPRSLVIVLDAGATMAEFDRFEIGAALLNASLLSLGPADSVAVVRPPEREREREREGGRESERERECVSRAC